VKEQVTTHDRTRTVVISLLLQRTELVRKDTMGRGALVFKGETKAKKKAKSKSKEGLLLLSPKEVHASAVNISAPDSAAAAALPNKSTVRNNKKSGASAAASPKIRTGRGRITVSGTVVTGIDTCFTKELAVGDAILVDNEMRVITMCLSDASLNISSPFVRQHHGIPVPFQYVPKPRGDGSAVEAQRRAAEEERQHEVEAHAFGPYSGGRGELVYRERTEHGNYRFKRAATSTGSTRSDLLEQRAKKTSDKYC
jgi:hypothetical protein